MKIDLETLKLLRAKTQAGMMDCRRALEECGGELEKAEALVASWGFSGQEDRADRPTPEGRIFLHAEGRRAVLVELLSETDFASRSGAFREAGAKLARLVWEKGRAGAEPELRRLIAELGTAIRENLALGRIRVLDSREGESIAAYLHDDGRIGALVLAHVGDGGSPEPQLGRPGAGASAPSVTGAAAELLHDLALHVAAFGPRFLDRAGVPSDYLAEKSEAFRSEVAEDPRLAEKPESIRMAAMEGKLRKHLSSVCLMDQPWIRDEARGVGIVLDDFTRSSGLALAIKDIAYAELGAAEA